MDELLEKIEQEKEYINSLTAVYFDDIERVDDFFIAALLQSALGPGGLFMLNGLGVLEPVIGALKVAYYAGQQQDK